MNSKPREERAGEADLDAIEMLAAEWLARRDRGLTPEELVEFAQWRALDPRHESAVADLSAMWNGLDDLSALQGKVVDFSAAAEPVRTRSRNWRPWVALAACVALVAGVALWRQGPAQESVVAAHYETAVGGQQTITLSDGSQLRLNTDSAIDVRMAAHERRIDLVRGEAHFTVTKDPTRPFIVTTEGVEARALGTSFIVFRQERATELVVTEGRVKFTALADQAATVEVGAGQGAVCDPQNPSAMRVVPFEAAALARRVAWESGLLICRKDMPLKEVAAEFNRHHREKLVLSDEATAMVTVGGGYKLSELDDLVSTLQNSFNIVVVERTPERIELKFKR